MADAPNDQEQKQAEEEAVKKKEDKSGPGGLNPKLVLLVLALNAVVLIALAVIATLNLKKQKSQVTLEDIAASTDEKKKEGQGDEKKEGHGEEHGHGEKKEGAEPSNFIKETFTVTLADSKGAHFAKVDIDIEVDEDFVRDELNRIRPKIRDFIIVALSSKTYEQVESVDGRDFLREEIRNKINGYLTKGQIKNIFFTQFIVQ